MRKLALLLMVVFFYASDAREGCVTNGQGQPANHRRSREAVAHIAASEILPLNHGARLVSVPALKAGGDSILMQTARSDPAAAPLVSGIYFKTVAYDCKTTSALIAKEPCQSEINGKFDPSEERNTKSPEAWTDITRFGARSVSAQPSTTASAAATSSTITLADGSAFENGDSLRLDFAGPVSTMSVPSHVVTTPSMNAGGTPVVAGGSGSSSYSYKVAACDKEGGCSAASPAAPTDTGNAGLGRYTVAITSISLSNNVMTVNTSSPHGFVANAMFYIQFFSTRTPLFEGWFMVSTVPDSRRITARVSFDSRVQGTPTFDNSGGTLFAYNANSVTWNAVPGAFKYYVYGRRGGDFKLLGQIVGGPSQPAILTWNDWGSIMEANQVFPSYAPNDAPLVPTRDYLMSTIVSGGGTNKIRIANVTKHGVSGVHALMGSDAAIQAAWQASVGGTMYIPSGSFYAAGYMKLTGAFGVGPAVLENGTLYLAETMELASGTRWVGWSGKTAAASFNWSPGAQIVAQGGAAYPMIYLTNGGSTRFQDMAFVNVAALNGGLMVYADAGVLMSWDYSYFAFGSSNPAIATDYIGQGMLFRTGGFDYRFNKCTFGGPQGPKGVESDIGYTFTPAYSFQTARWDGRKESGVGTGNVTVSHSWMVGRASMEFWGTDSGVGFFDVDDVSTQNLDFPAFVFNSYPVVNPVQGATYLKSLQPADYPTSMLANFNIGGTPFPLTLVNPSGALPGNHSYVTGNPVATMTLVNGSLSADNGGSVNVVGPESNVVANGGAQVGVAMTIPLAPESAVVGSGGNIPQGSHTYQLAGVDIFGRQTPLGPPINATTSSGKQTVTLILPRTPPAGATSYAVYRDGLFTVGAGGVCHNFNTVSIRDATYIDTQRSLCSQSALAVDKATSSALSDLGLSTHALILTDRGVTETLSAAPRAIFNGFFPALTTPLIPGARVTLDRKITVIRFQVVLGTAPMGCSTQAVVQITDGTKQISIDLANGRSVYDSGAISQDYGSGTTLDIQISTAAVGCTTSPANANLSVQYKMW